MVEERIQKVFFFFFLKDNVFWSRNLKTLVPSCKVGLLSVDQLW